MKVCTNKMWNAQTCGHGTEIADNGEWAKFTLYAVPAVGGYKETRKPVMISGTPRELRKLFRSALNGLKRTKTSVGT